MEEHPNIIFDNIIFSLQKAGGISKFWSKLITPFINNKEQVVFIENVNVDNIYRSELNIFNSQIIYQRIFFKIVRYLNLNIKYFNEKSHIFHSSYYRISNNPNSINVVTVHDLIYEKFEKGLVKMVHIYQKSIALKRADHIVCVSENTKKDLLEFYPFCKKKQISVIPNGVCDFVTNPIIENSSELKKISSSKPYFLYVGHRGDCKGFNKIHDAIDILGLSLNCIVVGGDFDSNELNEIKTRNHSNVVINVGRVTDNELNYLYSNAQFFFFPSLYEGFGIPPLEAMMSGCAVVASNMSSIPEVVGDSGIFFDPNSIESLKDSLCQVMNKDVRDRLIINGLKRVQLFDWDNITNSYFELYNSLLDLKKKIN